MKKLCDKTTSILLSIIGVIMAIVIPSKYIYDLDNPKIRDNYIDKVEVYQTVVAPDNQYETAIYNEKLSLNGDFSYSNSGGETETDNSYIADTFPVVACGTIIYDKYVKATIRIKKAENNKLITTIFNQNRESSNSPYTQIAKYFEEKSYYFQVNDSYAYDSNVYSCAFDFEKIKSYSSNKQTLSEKTISGLRNLVVRFNANDENGNDYNNRFVTNWETPSITVEGNYDIESHISANIYGGSLSKNSVSDFATTETNLAELTIDDSDNDYITVTIPKVFIGRTIYAVSTAIYTYGQANYSNLYPSKVVEIQQNVVRAEITIYGNTIGISLEDGTVTIGNGNQPFSLNGNELMQDSATTNNILTTSFLGNNILSQYRNGKETATLLCAIGEYYNEDGTLAISTKNNGLPMTFDIGNEAIPMVYKIPKGGTKPIDTPMSLYSSGNAKVFTIVSVEPIYDGAVWQRLTLLEKTE